MIRSLSPAGEMGFLGRYALIDFVNQVSGSMSSFYSLHVGPSQVSGLSKWVPSHGGPSADETLPFLPWALHENQL